jgi:hypothetical protein
VDELRWAYVSQDDGARPAVSLAAALGEHAGLGAVRVAAAAWTARAGVLPADGTLAARPVDRGPGLVHGLARRGSEVALVVTAERAAAGTERAAAGTERAA